MFVGQTDPTVSLKLAWTLNKLYINMRGSVALLLVQYIESIGDHYTPGY